MSTKFNDFKVTELYAYAKKKDIKVPFGRNRVVISEILTKNMVTEDDIEKYLKAKDEFGFDEANENTIKDEVFDKTDENVLVKMNRQNSVFEFGRYRFTKKDPYVVMNTTDANKLISKYDGFQLTSPQVVREFYS